MASWGNKDNAANTPLWAIAAINKNWTSANQTSLFDNTTVDAFKVTTAGGTDRLANVAIGVFGIDANESRVEHGAIHTGWVLRKSFTGGRAGRVQEEVLVALNTINSDADGQIYANVAISLSTPSNASVLANASFANVVSFSVTPTLTGNTSSTLTYQWQYLNGTTWASVTANNSDIHYSGATTPTLYAIPGTTAASGTKYRLHVTAADEGVTANSSNVVITIT